MHGGSVSAQSLGVGQGATFTVLLPEATAEQKLIAQALNEKAPKAGVESAAPDLKGLRILLVDDEDSAREAHREILRSFGATTLDVASSKEALEAISTFWPDVLISDIAMPTEDGYHLIHQVRKLDDPFRRDIPAIALTAYAGTEARNCALKEGFDDYLAKPFEGLELARNITDLWSRRSVRKKAL